MIANYRHNDGTQVAAFQYGIEPMPDWFREEIANYKFELPFEGNFVIHDDKHFISIAEPEYFIKHYEPL